MILGSFPKHCVKCQVPVDECLKPMAYVLQNPESLEWFGARNVLGEWMVVLPGRAPRNEEGRVLFLPIQVDPFWDAHEEVKRGLMCDRCSKEGLDFKLCNTDGEAC